MTLYYLGKYSEVVILTLFLHLLIFKLVCENERMFHPPT